MPQKLPLIVRPAALRYDQGESLPGGAQFMKFDRVDELEAYWARSKGERPYACCGTGATEPALFLDSREWIFAPTREALVAAVTRWEEFGILCLAGTTSWLRNGRHTMKLKPRDWPVDIGELRMTSGPQRTSQRSSKDLRNWPRAQPPAIGGLLGCPAISLILTGSASRQICRSIRI
jgi:hypothetical protein